MIFERDIANSIWDEFSGHEIVFLLGTRQTGKTTIAKILQGKWKNENSLYIDLEDRSYRNSFNASSIDTLKNVLLIEGINVKKPGLLILDEVQLRRLYASATAAGHRKEFDLPVFPAFRRS